MMCEVMCVQVLFKLYNAYQCEALWGCGTCDLFPQWVTKLQDSWGPLPSAGLCTMALVIQLCPTLWDPMDCSLPDSSAHGILQARIQEWVGFPLSRPISRLMCICNLLSDVYNHLVTNRMGRHRVRKKTSELELILQMVSSLVNIVICKSGVTDFSKN